IQIVLILIGGFFLTHRLIPWAVRRIGRALGFSMKLSPMWQKRISRFKTIKRGYYSFRLITTLFVLSFFLELMVNSKALFIYFDGNWSMPAVKEWVNKAVPFKISTFNRRSDFGQYGAAEVDYRRFQAWSREPALCRAAIAKEKFAQVREASTLLSSPVPGPTDPRSDLLSWNGKQVRIESGKARIEAMEEAYKVYKAGNAFCLMPLYPYSPKEHLLEELIEKPPTRPSWGHPLGTDDSGLDVLTFLVYGFRISILFALLVASVGYTVGVIVGGIMGYYGGWTDILVQRFIEIWSSVPFLYTIMIIASAFTPTFPLLVILLIVLRSWMGITYTIRGEFYREKARDYVQAAIAMGTSDWKVMTRHILPNSLVPVVSFAPFGIVAYIGSLVSLDYLGFGLPVGTPSWGHLLSQGQTHILHYPHLILAPSVALMLTLFCVVMIGEAVREAFDPKVFSRLR
ncbi:MAG: ABC transporter permease subunit, partial [Planctomycetota bacterium]